MPDLRAAQRRRSGRENHEGSDGIPLEVRAVRAALGFMKYQLVLQFRAKRTQDFDELIVLEDLLIENLLATSEVDGHDFASDEFNIFVLTNQPRESFREAEKIIEQHHPRQQLKAAYRELGKEEFVILWPPNLQEFKIV